MRPHLVLLLLTAVCAALANAGSILVMKSCAPSCTNSTVSSEGRTLSVSCCPDSQCYNAASGLAGGLGAAWACASASLLLALLQAAR